MFDQQTQPAAPAAATVEIPRAPRAVERAPGPTDEEIYRVALSNTGASIGKNIGKAERSLDRLEDGAGISSVHWAGNIFLLKPKPQLRRK
jgi:hypothetical protein